MLSLICETNSSATIIASVNIASIKPNGENRSDKCLAKHPNLASDSDNDCWRRHGKRRAIRLSLSVAAIFLSCSAIAAAQATGEVIPQSGPLTEVSTLVESAIADGEMPGAVIGIWHRDKWLMKQAFGNRQVEPEVVPMTLDTVFDMASLTKPVATATSIWKLIQDGKIDPAATAITYLPEFQGKGKDAITVRQLLIHTAGLIPDNALADYLNGPELAWQRINDLSLRSDPGEKFAYTDVGFLVLGRMVEKVSGQSLDKFAEENIFMPLGMTDTTYCPGESLKLRAAPTEKQNDIFIRGTVHDPRAAALGGVAGHAGLFSTVDDMQKYGAMLLEALRDSGDADQDAAQEAQPNDAKKVLTGETVRRMIEPQRHDRGTRTSGWDHKSPYSSNRGEGMSDQAFGHGGFTGTAMWIDPAHDLVVIFLSNRLHPDGKGTVNPLAGKIGGLAIRTVTEAE